MSELDEARANHGLTLGLLAKVIKERDQWKERAIELQAEPAAMTCAMLQQDDLLEAYRSLAKAADAMCAEYRDCAWSTDTQSAYDTARATVANLDRSTPATTEQKAAAGKGGA